MDEAHQELEYDSQQIYTEEVERDDDVEEIENDIEASRPLSARTSTSLQKLPKTRSNSIPDSDLANISKSADSIETEHPPNSVAAALTAAGVNVPKIRKKREKKRADLINWRVVWNMPQRVPKAKGEDDDSDIVTITETNTSMNSLGSTGRTSKRRTFFRIPGMIAGKWRFQCWVRGDSTRIPVIEGISVRLSLISGMGVILFEKVTLKPKNIFEICKFEFDVLEQFAPAILEVTGYSPRLCKIDLAASLSNLVVGNEYIEVPNIGLFDPEELTYQEKVLFERACLNWSPCEAFVLDFDFGLAMQQLSRRSDKLAEAKKIKLMRPFLLLVSMHPERRLFWARAMGIDLIKKKYYPDPHEEAWELINKNPHSIRVKVRKAFTEKLNPFASHVGWHDVVYRVCSTVFVRRESLTKKNSEVDHELRSMIRSCKRSSSSESLTVNTNSQYSESVKSKPDAFKSSPNMMDGSASPTKSANTSTVGIIITNPDEEDEEESQTLGRYLSQLSHSKEESVLGYERAREIEEVLCLAFMYKMKEKITPYEQKLDYLENQARSERGMELRHNMLKSGFVNTKLVDFSVGLALSGAEAKDLVMHMIGWAASKQSGNLSALLFKSDPGALTPIMLGLLIQRIFLSLVNIKVEDYYIEDEK
eukprot:TRINITY_DN6165_c0_g1_i1.p1 TRINITY_DN6165_c0_g1~~TRINITY_DN6165_c0_g1_i1.p1  ORF type:complete len:648 (+),score=174.68 TRINITY_DN6165_c0_g1_i1:590-2533(+)